MPRGSRIGTREEILSTALELFLVQGYDATSLREIAERLDITKAALYYHFPAKEQLVIELCRDFLDSLSELVVAARAQRAEGKELCRAEMLAAYLDLLVEHRRLVQLLSANPATQNHPDVGMRARNLVDAFTHELAGPDSASEEKLRVACAIGVVNGAALRPPSKPEERAVVLGAALGALTAPPFALADQFPPRGSDGEPDASGGTVAEVRQTS